MPEAEARRWSVLTLCLAAGFMTLLDVSIVNVALPSIQSGLHASSSSLAWVVSGYALTFGLVLVPAGRFGDDFGRSRMFRIALALFTVASALAGVATHELWLVFARLLQGAAGGLLNPQVLGLMQQLFQGPERGRAFGWFGAVVGVSTAIGPMLGGLIIQLAGPEQGWRWVFFVNIPIGIVALWRARRLLPADPPRHGGTSVDVGGIGLLAGTLICLLLPLVEHGGGNPPRYLLLVAPALLVAFVLWERRYSRSGRPPLVDLRLLRLRSYSFGAAIGLVYFAGFTSIFFVLALYFQRGVGYSPLEAGLAMTPFALGSAVFAALSGRLVHRVGRRIVLVGLTTALVGLLITDTVLRFAHGPIAGWATALPLLLAGCGSGMVISPNQTVTLSEVDTSQGGTAAGVQQTGQRLGSAVGIAAASGLFFATLAHGGYAAAISAGLVVSVCFVGVALALGLLEQATARRG